MELQLITFAGVLILVGVLFSLIKNIFKKTLHKACSKGDIEGVKQFLGKGADVNAEDKHEWTPLHYAAYNGHTKIAKFLVGSGADVNAKEIADETPLHKSAFGGHKETAELLIAKGADVNAKNESGWTPLHEATDWRHEEIVELLIAAGADVNAKREDGQTPLDWADVETSDLLRKHGGKYGTIHGAIDGGDAEAVKEFLAAGADVNAKSAEFNQTPIEAANETNHPEIADLLRKHGGKTGEELKAEGK